MSALDDLIHGFKHFQQQYFVDDQKLFKQFNKKGQHPKIMMIACADSRVDPALLFNITPGDIFVVRNVANLVPPCEHDDAHHGVSAALEFAVNGLQVEHIIIMGHSNCGGIQALLQQHDQLEQYPFVSRWMGIAEAAYQTTIKSYKNSPEDQQVTACAKLSLRHSLANLTTFPWIEKKVAEKKLGLHAWYFDMQLGDIIDCGCATEQSIAE